MNATSSTLQRLSSTMATLLGLCAIAGCSVTLLGWLLALPALTDWHGDDIPMFANTALMGIGCGASLVLAAWAAPRSQKAVFVLGLLTAALAAATLFQHVSGLSLGIDSLLVEHRWGSRAAMIAGRPGPPASVCFTLLGTALMLSTAGARARAVAAALGVVVSAVALVTLTGFLLGADQLFGIVRYTGVALQTSTTLLGLSLGLVARLHDREPMRTLCDAGGAGLLARRAFPAVLLLPLVLGWLHLHGLETGWFDEKLGTALLTTFLVLLLCAVLWACAAAIALRETAVRMNEEALYQKIADRQRMAKVLETRVHEQAVLYHFVDRLHRAACQQDILDPALDCIQAALGCDRSSILLRDTAGTMRFVAWRGLSAGYRSAVEGHSTWQADEREPRPLCIGDVDAADLPAHLRTALKAEGIRALAFIPLVSGGRLAGKFMLYHDRPYVFSPAELELGLVVARQFGFGLRRMQAEEALRSSEELLRSITDHSLDVIFVKDRGSRMLFINPAGVRMSGLTTDTIIGRTDAESLPGHPEQAARFMEADRRVMDSGQPESIEEEVCSATGQTYTLLTTKTPRLDAEGKFIGIVGISRDVTESKRDEQRLRDAARRAEEAARAKDDFLAALSHELRTPLTPVLMTAGTLEADPALDGEVRDAFAMIRRNVQLEARLIDDLLDLTRITRGKLSIRRVPGDLHLLIHHAHEIARGDGIDKNITVRLELDASDHHVNGDPTRLQQVLWNLLKNALKFTPDKGTVILRTCNPRPGRIEVRVTDTGIGIAPEALTTIFNAFEQGSHGTRHQFGGLGLGLAISRAIVKHHEGTLRAESGGPGRGATFILELATCPEPEPGRR